MTLKLRWPRSLRTWSTFFLVVVFLIQILVSELQSVQKNPVVLYPSPVPTIKPVAAVLAAEFDATLLASPAAWFVGKEKVRVEAVIDGDTIKIEGGKKVRYIGIDTPETSDPRRGVECFGQEAKTFNQQLVLGQEVWLEKDISETDRYGRLLRYVYLVGSESDEASASAPSMINRRLVEEGYAEASSYPPDIKYQADLLVAEQRARGEKKGMWADGACDSFLN